MNWSSTGGIYSSNTGAKNILARRYGDANSNGDCSIASENETGLGDGDKTNSGKTMWSEIESDEDTHYLYRDDSANIGDGTLHTGTAQWRQIFLSNSGAGNMTWFTFQDGGGVLSTHVQAKTLSGADLHVSIGGRSGSNMCSVDYVRAYDTETVMWNESDYTTPL